MPLRDPPPRRLPLAYFALGHVALLYALFVTATEPAAVGGFFLSPRTIAVVHLLTLGWITHSIIGATYLAAPLALRADFPARRLDGVACVTVAIGASGVIAHFFMDEYSGIAWSGGMLVSAFGFLAIRIWIALARSATTTPVKLLVGCAYLNLLLTALLGILLAVNKRHPFLPQDHLQAVFAHAHIGLIGWGLLMLVGIGLRMLPMFLPAKPPSPKSSWALVFLLEGGILLLGSAWLLRPELARFAALVPAAGVVWFLFLVVQMLRNRLPAAKKLRRPDIGMLHVLQALCYLAIATVLGLRIVFAEQLELGLIMAYGAITLLGFLGQVILGVQMRLVPMNAWLQAWTRSGYTERPPSPHEMPIRPLQAVSFLMWTVGVPMLAFGLAKNANGVISTGAWLLLGGTLSATMSTIAVLRRAN